MDVRNLLNEERKSQISENRARLEPIIKTIILLGQQNIPLRGHRDDGNIFQDVQDPDDTDSDSSLIKHNDGNFKALLRFRVDAGDQKLNEHLKNANSNSTYISKTTCNSLINCCGEEILNVILNRVNTAVYYSVIFDETTDISHCSQLSISLRYIYNNLIREDFVGFTNLHSDNYGHITDSAEERVKTEPKIGGQILGQTVIRQLEVLGLNLDHCVGIGCDGCSVNISEIKGAAAEIQKYAKNAVLSSCFNHALNLTISKCSNVKSIKNVIGIIQELVSFFNASAKRNFVLQNHLKHKLKSPCETRWVQRHDSIIQLRKDLDKICGALDEITNWEENVSSTKANILLKAILDCEFIITIYVLSDILSLTLPLSVFLQSKGIDMDVAISHVATVIDVLKQKRANADSEFDCIMKEVSNIMDTLGVELRVPRLAGKQTNRSNIPASDPKDYWKKIVYIPLFDYVLNDFVNRFSNKILQCFSLNFLIPKNLINIKTVDELKEKAILISKQFSNLTNDGEIEPTKLLGEMQLFKQTITKETTWKTATCTVFNIDQEFYPIITKYLKILVTLPISVATAERSFSTLRRLKTWTRSRITQDRLVGLALLHVHRDIHLNTENIINRFGKDKRKIEFIL